jgi:hypothetical protein
VDAEKLNGASNQGAVDMRCFAARSAVAEAGAPQETCKR